MCTRLSPNHISITAFLAARVLPGVSFRQHDGPIRAKRVLPCAIGRHTALFPLTFVKHWRIHIFGRNIARTEQRHQRTPLSSYCQLCLAGFCQTRWHTRASYTHGTLAHANQHQTSMNMTVHWHVSTNSAKATLPQNK